MESYKHLKTIENHLSILPSTIKTGYQEPNSIIRKESQDKLHGQILMYSILKLFLLYIDQCIQDNISDKLKNNNDKRSKEREISWLEI